MFRLSVTRARAVAWVARASATFFLLAACTPVLSQSSVCAEVRIEIRQKVSLERQAFDAVLRIRNGLTALSIEDVGVELLFADASGTPVSASDNPDNTEALFFTRMDGLENIGTVDGSGSVAPTQTAVARWLIIPSASSGGVLPAGRQYLIGARLSYRLGESEPTIVDVVPETITVRPQPRLKLDYFLAGDVYADDAFTPQIEPPIPFTFGVRVANNGAGLAQRLRIESAQPSIVENEQGLLIGFEILGGHVDNQSVAPSLLLDFGDIEPGTSRMGRWRMQTTLSGRFTEIDARYSHADALGGALTSLIDGEPVPHLLVRDVLVDLPGRDSVRDYLARDEDVLRVYESNGQDVQVADLSVGASLSPTGAPGDYTLTLPAQVGHTYMRVPDPLGGASDSIQAQRGNGTLLPAANVWFSKTRNENLTWSYFINVFDAREGAPYRLILDAPAAVATMQGSVYADSNGNGVRDVDETGLADVALKLEGQTADATIDLSALSQADGSWLFEALPAGDYTIVVGSAAGRVDGVHHAGSAGGVVTGDRIDGIALAQGQAATGYLFAKIAPDALPSADLELIGLSAQATVERNASTKITLQAGNIGPQATLASAAVTLPASFEIDESAATRGAFDPGAHIWQIGALAPGDEAGLVLTGRYTVAGHQTVSASVVPQDDPDKDPDPSNNARSADIEVIGVDPLLFDAGTRTSTRLLVLATCVATADPGCATGRAQRWQTLLDDDTPHLVTADPAAFVAALRDGDWNALWIDGDGVPPASLLIDAREALRRGASLLLSGLRSAHWQRFEQLAGVTVGVTLPAATRSVVLVPSEYFAAGSIPTQDAATTYTASQGRVLADYDGGGGAIAASASNAAERILLFGFDPLPGLEISGTSGLVAGIASGAAVDVPEILLSGARLPLHALVVWDAADDVPITAGFVFPASFSIVDAIPVPLQSSADRVHWNVTTPAPLHRFDAALDLRAPSTAGLFALTAFLDVGEDEQRRGISVRVRDAATQLLATQGALSQLMIQDAQEAGLEPIAALLTAATTAQAEGRIEDARAALLDAIALLDGIDGAAPVSLEFSRLMLLFSRVPGVAPAEPLFSDGFEAAP